MTFELSPDDESYATANLSPRMTGLTRHVFVSPRMASHDVRINVSVSPGKKTLPIDCASVALRPNLHQMAGPPLPPSVIAEVAQWAAINEKALQDYWDGVTDTGELLAALKRI